RSKLLLCPAGGAGQNRKRDQHRCADRLNCPRHHRLRRYRIPPQVEWQPVSASTRQLLLLPHRCRADSWHWTNLSVVHAGPVGRLGGPWAFVPELGCCAQLAVPPKIDSASTTTTTDRDITVS